MDYGKWMMEDNSAAISEISGSYKQNVFPQIKEDSRRSYA